MNDSDAMKSIKRLITTWDLATHKDENEANYELIMKIYGVVIRTGRFDKNHKEKDC